VVERSADAQRAKPLMIRATVMGFSKASRSRLKGIGDFVHTLGHVILASIRASSYIGFDSCFEQDISPDL